jgi:hypothetical protein
VPERWAVSEEFRQFFIQVGDRPGFIETESLGGGFRAMTKAVPDFPRGVFFPAKQDGTPARQHQRGFGKTSQIPEI